VVFVVGSQPRGWVVVFSGFRSSIGRDIAGEESGWLGRSRDARKELRYKRRTLHAALQVLDPCAWTPSPVPGCGGLLERLGASLGAENDGALGFLGAGLGLLGITLGLGFLGAGLGLGLLGTTLGLGFLGAGLGLGLLGTTLGLGFLGAGLRLLGAGLRLRLLGARLGLRFLRAGFGLRFLGAGFGLRFLGARLGLRCQGTVQGE